MVISLQLARFLFFGLGFLGLCVYRVLLLLLLDQFLQLHSINVVKEIDRVCVAL